MKRDNLHRKRMFEWWLSGGDTPDAILWDDGDTMLWDDSDILSWGDVIGALWILASGLWEDANVWIDSSVWID